MLKQIKLFQNSIKSPQTKRTYMILLQKYMDYVGKDKDPFFGDNSKLIQECIIDFIIKMKEQNKTYSAIHNYVTPIISFYKINDIVLNTKKINKFLPEYVKVKKDRPYTHDEISKLLEIADEKMRVVILLLASTGIRIGGIPSLMLRNLEEIEDSYKVTVYENTNEEYITFTTPECKKAIDSYLGMRKSYGEKINGDSYLIREYFNNRDPNRIRKPHKLTVYTLEWKLMELAKRCLIRKIEHQTEGKYIASMRKDVAIAHGFRKFFATICERSKVDPEVRERLLGHDIGLTLVYVKKSVEEIYEEYEKAIDNLTIDPANRLRKKIQTLQVEKSLLEDMALRLEALEKKSK